MIHWTNRLVWYQFNNEIFLFLFTVPVLSCFWEIFERSSKMIHLSETIKHFYSSKIVSRISANSTHTFLSERNNESKYLLQNQLLIHQGHIFIWFEKSKHQMVNVELRLQLHIFYVFLKFAKIQRKILSYPDPQGKR